MYVTNVGSSSMAAITFATNATKTVTGVGTAPTGVVLSADGTKAYITSAGGVTVLNTATNTVTATVAIGSPAYTAALSTDRKTLLVANANQTLTLIDTATNTVLETVPAGTGTGNPALVVSPDGVHTYLTDPTTGNLQVITITAATNTPPAIGTPQESIPNTTTGTVTGQVIATDADGDTLTYTLTSPPADGATVTVNPTTGQFSYTPTTVQRLNAMQAANPTDTFSVTVSDGQATTIAPVSVSISGLAYVPTTTSTAAAGQAVAALVGGVIAI